MHCSKCQNLNEGLHHCSTAFRVLIWFHAVGNIVLWYLFRMAGVTLRFQNSCSSNIVIGQDGLVPDAPMRINVQRVLMCVLKSMDLN